MSDPQPDQAEHTSSRGSSVWRARLTSSFPFLLTMLAAVALSLFIQAAFAVRQQPVVIAPTPAPDASPTPAPTPGPPATPVPTPPQPDERIISQEILDLQLELDEVWGAVYLLRAANQLADAENALQVNELSEVERLLVTVNVSLDHAYELSAEQNKGPIGEFRVNVADIHEDLQVRPDGVDLRLRRLRQDMLTLVNTES